MSFVWTLLSYWYYFFCLTLLGLLGDVCLSWLACQYQQCHMETLSTNILNKQLFFSYQKIMLVVLPPSMLGRTRPWWANSLCLGDAMWRHKSGSTLAQVMACCPRTPSHYLHKCWSTSLRFGDIHLRGISQEMLKVSILVMSLKTANSILQPRLPKTNAELNKIN